MRNLLAPVICWIWALRRPAQTVSLDGLSWHRRDPGETLNVTSAWMTRQRELGCATFRLRLSTGQEVAVTMPVRSADRLAREILRAPLRPEVKARHCRRPPRWLASAFPRRRGRFLPEELMP